MPRLGVRVFGAVLAVAGAVATASGASVGSGSRGVFGWQIRSVSMHGTYHAQFAVPLTCGSDADWQISSESEDNSIDKVFGAHSTAIILYVHTVHGPGGPGNRPAEFSVMRHVHSELTYQYKELDPDRTCLGVTTKTCTTDRVYRETADIAADPWGNYNSTYPYRSGLVAVYWGLPFFSTGALCVVPAPALSGAGVSGYDLPRAALKKEPRFRYTSHSGTAITKVSLATFGLGNFTLRLRGSGLLRGHGVTARYAYQSRVSLHKLVR